MAATTTLKHGKSFESAIVRPAVHPTYDLKAVIKLALSGDKGRIFLNTFTHYVTFQLFESYVL